MKNVYIALAVSVILNLLCVYINYQSYHETNYLKWSYRNHGGEITIEFSPGWRAVHIYSMRSSDKDSHSLAFSPISLFISVLSLMLVGWAVLAKFSTGVLFKDFLLLLIGYVLIFFVYRMLMELWDEFS